MHVFTKIYKAKVVIDLNIIQNKVIFSPWLPFEKLIKKINIIGKWFSLLLYDEHDPCYYSYLTLRKQVVQKQSSQSDLYIIFVSPSFRKYSMIPELFGNMKVSFYVYINDDYGTMPTNIGKIQKKKAKPIVDMNSRCKVFLIRYFLCVFCVRCFAVICFFFCYFLYSLWKSKISLNLWLKSLFCDIFSNINQFSAISINIYTLPINS